MLVVENNEIACFYLSISIRLLQVKRTECKNCLVWAKSDNLVREISKLSSDVMVRTRMLFSGSIYI